MQATVCFFLCGIVQGLQRKLFRRTLAGGLFSIGAVEGISPTAIQADVCRRPPGVGLHSAKTQKIASCIFCVFDAALNYRKRNPST